MRISTRVAVLALATLAVAWGQEAPTTPADGATEGWPAGAVFNVGTARYFTGLQLTRALLAGRTLAVGAPYFRWLGVADAVTGRERGRIVTTDGGVFALSDDGAEIAFVDSARELSIVDALAPTRVRRLGVRIASSLEAVSFSHEGHRVAALESDGHLWICDPTSGRSRSVAAPAIRAEAPTSLTFRSDDRELVLFDFKHQAIHRIDPETGETHSMKTGAHGVGAVSPGGKRVAVQVPHAASIVDVATGESTRLPIAGGEPDNFFNVAVSPDGRLLAGMVHTTDIAYDIRTRIEVYDIEKKEKRLSIPADVRWVSFSPDGTRLVTVTPWTHEGDGVEVLPFVGIWDVATGKDLREGGLDPPTSFALSLDGSQVATGARGRVLIWDVATRKPIRTVPTEHDVLVTALAYSPDSKYLAGTVARGAVRVWDAKTGDLVRALRTPPHGNPSRASCLAFVSSGTCLIWGEPGGGEYVTRSDLSSGDSAFLKHGADFVGGAFVHDRTGSRIFTLRGVFGELVAKGWQFESGLELGSLERSGAERAAFSPSGALVAVASPEGVKIIDFDKRVIVGQCPRGGVDIDALAFTPEGERLVLAGSDKRLRIVDLDGTERERFEVGDRVRELATSRDGLIAARTMRGVVAWRLGERRPK